MMKILLYDIETSPNLAYVWGKYQQDVIAYEHEWEILSFAHKWLGERKVYCHSQRDMSEKALARELWCLFDEADIIIAHNGDRFDQRKSNTKFLQYKHPPPDSYKTVDTLKVARKYFKFNSNRLNDLAVTLGVGEKVKHTGFDLWKGCMEGDPKSWRLMERYNKQDVRLLEKVYMKLRGWIDRHPSVARQELACTVCGSKNFVKKGWEYQQTTRYQRYRCKDCGKKFQDTQKDPNYKVLVKG